MRTWLYGRISNDEDMDENSQQNQLSICQSFAQNHGYTIVGQSFDDHISGMVFSRPGPNRLTAAVEERCVDCIVVKDLSRLGRHHIQTAMFIDYLRQQNVRVISATEGMDTFCEDDELIIGVRGLMNDFYVRDMSNKIRAGYRQKQREGLVITPPFGYRKDRNTNQIRIHPEAAETVQMIYAWYLQGCGQKEIARRLNALGRKTPAELRAEQCGNEYHAARKNKDGKYLWSYVSVKNVLMEEAYTGLLRNHMTNTRNGKRTSVPKEEWLCHENYFPVIVEPSQWEQTQRRLKENVRTGHGNRPKHRYAGLLRCRECSNVFVPMNRYWNGACRVEYVCKSYHRGGKRYCTSHRIRESELDTQVQQFAEELRSRWTAEQAELWQLQKMWALKRPAVNARITALYEEIQRLEQEIDDLLLEKIQNGG